MPGLSNDYIEKLMYKLSVNPQKFKGVKPCDIFLNEIEQNQYILEEGDSIIINLSSSNNSGSHFVSIHISFNPIPAGLWNDVNCRGGAIMAPD